MSHWPLLSLVTFLPLVGVGFIMTSRGEDAIAARNARNIAMSTSLIVFVLSIALWVEFDPSTPAFQFVERARWVSIGGFTINYHLGIDGISLYFVLFYTLLTGLSGADGEAPTAVCVFLAGVLLKLGGYRFIRFSLPMFPAASAYFTPLVFALSAIAIIYTSFVALAQTDMKKLIAYSSVAHMGLVTMGLFALTSEAVQGAVIQMLSHGLVSAALFLVVGVDYDRLHTRDIDRYGGLVERMPVYAFVFMCFMLASIGLPGTSGFVGEILILLGTFRVSTLECFLASTALFRGAMYMRYFSRRVFLRHV